MGDFALATFWICQDGDCLSSEIVLGACFGPGCLRNGDDIGEQRITLGNSYRKGTVCTTGEKISYDSIKIGIKRLRDICNMSASEWLGAIETVTPVHLH